MSALMRSKEEELVSSRQQHTEEVARLVAELRQLRESYEAKIKEYEELMDIRIQLDQEIATYRALLHEEETRLGHPGSGQQFRTPWFRTPWFRTTV